MSEKAYLQVEDVIRRKLFVGAPGRTALGGPRWAYPDRIELGDVVMRDADCGLAKPTFVWTLAEWSENVLRHGLWRKVGMWDFVRADDEAAEAIAFCHRSPGAAGRELHRLRNEAKPKETP